MYIKKIIKDNNKKIHPSSFLLGMFLAFASILFASSNSQAAGSNITINSNTTWAAGTYNYGNITVTNNAVLTLQGVVVINADNVTVDTGSAISGNGQGYAEATGTGAGVTSWASGGGGGHGGNGGNGGYSGTLGGIAYGSNTNPITLGSGGGHGGAAGATGGTGGSAIKFIVIGTFLVNGSVSTNGTIGGNDSFNVGGGGGGGSGGSIWVDAGTIAGTGSVAAIGGNGGKASSYGRGGGGAGGRVAMYYFVKTYSGAISTAGGLMGSTGSSTGASNGGVGTINEKIKAYYSSGTYTSPITDTGQKSNFSTLTYNATKPANTALTIDVRGGNTATPDGTWTAWQTGVSNGGDISALTGNQYVQYRANLSTTDANVTPSLDDVTFNYSYIQLQNLLATTHTSDSDFATLNKATNMYIVGSGVAAGLTMTKFDGAACTLDAQCAGGWCNVGVCGSHWTSGPCSGIQVYQTDLGGMIAWKTSQTNCDTPQCGIDGAQDGDNLVSDNAVNFSSYPARNTCKSVGGRLPTKTELACIYTNRASYNTNGVFQPSVYLTSAEYNTTNVWGVDFSNGNMNNSRQKDYTWVTYARCVR